MSANDITTYRIDLAGVSSKHDLLAAIARSLPLPDYFGMNWDALEECLRDLDTEKTSGWVLVFEHAERLLQISQEDLATFGSILSAVSAFWVREGRSFSHILKTSDAAAEEQLALLHDL